MEGLGTSAEELKQALTLILERRRVSQDLLKAHFGSSARATNMLSVLEMNKFITKPFGGQRWEINYVRIEQFLNNPTSITEDSDSSDTTDGTIKGGGLPVLLKGLYLADRSLNIARLLTTDLTVSEIDSSLELIEQTKKQYNDFIQRYKTLVAKQAALETPVENLQEKISELKENSLNGGSAGFIISYILGLCVLIGACAFAKAQGVPSIIIISIGTILAITGLWFVINAVGKENARMAQLNLEQDDLKRTLQSLITDREHLEEEQENLAKSCGLSERANSMSVASSQNRLSELTDILKKMKSILLDPQESQSKRLLALEQYIYIINKKYTDSQLIAKQQEATDYAREQAQYAKEQAEEARKQTQATKDVEAAIRNQTEFQAYVELMKDMKERYK